MSRNYVNLHSHTSYSMLDGLGSVDAYMERAAELGMPALAQTDHGNLYGWLDFYEAGKKHGVKSVLGIEAYLARKTRFDRDEEESTGPATSEFEQRGPYHITLLAHNKTGYQNLIKMSSESFLTGFYRYPRMDLDLFAEYSEGITALSGCLNGPLNQALMAGDTDLALRKAGELQDIFGKDRFFIEVMNHGIQEELDVLPDLVDIAGKIGAKIIPTQDSHYVRKEDSDAHDLLLCVATNARVDEEKRFRFMEEEFFLRNYEEMLDRFGEPQWLKNTLDVAESVELDLEFGELHFPDPHLPENVELEDYFTQQVWEGIKYRYGDNPSDAVRARTEHEMRVIKEMGFPGYFIVVADIMEFCRNAGIMVGPGRGSAAASIVSYAMQITQIEPLEYDLPFERFLVEGRMSPPDIDIDIDDRRRGEVIEYVRDKYGEDRVAHIGTFSQTGAKQAIRDAARVMNYEYSKGDEVAKLVPDPVLGVNKSVEESLATPDMRKAYSEDADTKKIIDGARGIEGVFRQTGIHAAGVVISKGPIVDYVPVMQRANKDGSRTPVTTQWDMERVEQCGQLKVDFLGLRNLGVLDLCIQNIEERTGEKIDIYSVPLDDPDTYQMLKEGRAIGVFQVEGQGIREMMISLQPENIRDLMALISLYRPGPMGSGMDKLFIARKHGRNIDMRQPHPILDELLHKTYGIMLYQEDILTVAREIAGFSPLEADTLRKATGKKKFDVMEKLRARFIEGSVSTGKVKSRDAEAIFGDIEYFGGYGFNSCLIGDTLIATTDGELSIDEISQKLDDDEKVYGYSFQNGDVIIDECIEVIDAGIQEVFEITMEDGSTFEATLDHKFLCEDGIYHTVRGIMHRNLGIVSLDDELKITSGKPKGKKQVYNLSMRSEPHNYALASGLVSKNSHAISYSFISYWTAYFKKNYPAEYMAALLGSVKDKIDKAGSYLNEARDMGLNVLPPSINRSSKEFKVLSDSDILFGLSSITGVGETIVDRIVESRQGDGYTTLYDLFKGIDPDAMNKGVMEHLLYAGALDELVPAQETRLISRDERMDILMKESDNLGLYVIEHPLDGIWMHLEPEISHTFDQFEDLSDRQRVEAAGIVTSVSKKYTKRGDKMYVLQVQDPTGTCEVVVFPQVAATVEEFEQGQILLLKGRVQQSSAENNTGAKMALVDFEEPDLPDFSMGRPIMIHLKEGIDSKTVESMIGLVDRNPGEHPVFLLKQEGEFGPTIKMQIKKPASLSIEEQLTFMGSNN